MKMKNIKWILILILMFWVLDSNAQSAWTRLSGIPQENSLNEIVKVPGTNKLVAVGEGATVLISEDGGENWELVLNPAGLANYHRLTNVCFVSESTGFFANSDGLIFKSNDGGYHWELKHDVSRSWWGEISEIEFLDEQKGFAVGNDGLILKTTDAGENWIKEEMEIGFDLDHIEFINSSKGYIYGCSGYQMLETNDGGENWELVPLTDELQGVYVLDIISVSDSLAFISGERCDETTVIYRSTDRGQHWNPVFTSSYWYMTPSNFAFFDDQNGILALPTPYNSATAVLTTEDSGVTWNEKLPYGFSASDAKSICILDDSAIFSVGYYGAICKSENMGQDWQDLNQKIIRGNIINIQFLNENEGFVQYSGQGGGVATFPLMKTVDGGCHWEQVSAPITYSGCYHFLDGNNGFYATNAMNLTLCITNDCGENWIYKTTCFDFEPRVVRFYDFKNGLIAGVNHIFRTENGGDSWEDIALCGEMGIDVFDIEYKTKDLVFAVGDPGVSGILKSVDAGKNWEWIEIADFHYAEDIFFLNESIAFIASRSGIFKSTNGGDSWHRTITNNPNYIDFRRIYFPTEDVGYAVGSGSFENMVKSTDGGESWVALPTYESSPLTGLYFSDENNGLIFGENGIVMQTTSGGLVGMEERDMVEKDPFFMLYPNPADRTLSIFIKENGQCENACIELTDCLGKSIQSHNLQQGAILKLDIQDCAPGIYFVQLISSGNLLEVQKVVVR